MSLTLKILRKSNSNLFSITYLKKKRRIKKKFSEFFLIKSLLISFTQGAKISPPPIFFFCRRETRYLLSGSRSAWEYFFETTLPKSDILINKRIQLEKLEILGAFSMFFNKKWNWFYRGVGDEAPQKKFAI